MRVLFEPGWEEFLYKCPRLLSARLAGEAGPRGKGPLIYDRWQETSGPILDFQNEWMALRVPLPPQGQATLESVGFEIALRLVTTWSEVRLALPEGEGASTVKAGGLTYTLDQCVVDEGLGFTARLVVRKPQVSRGVLARLFSKSGGELDMEGIDFGLELEEGNPCGFVSPRMTSMRADRYEVMLSGLLLTGESSGAKRGPWKLVVRRPDKVNDGKLVFSLGPLSM